MAKLPLYWKKWAKNGIVFIRDLLNNGNFFLGYSEINRKYNIKCNFLIYNKLGKAFHLCGGIYYTNLQNPKQSILI